MELSTPPLARTTPVTPPTVNMKMKPKAQSIGVWKVRLPPHIVAIQLKILIPVGTAITIVAAVKYILVFTSMPTVNMWWAQTMKPTTPIATMRSEEHTSELQSLMRISYADFCLNKTIKTKINT